MTPEWLDTAVPLRPLLNVCLCLRGKAAVVVVGAAVGL